MGVLVCTRVCIYDGYDYCHVENRTNKVFACVMSRLFNISGEY